METLPVIKMGNPTLRKVAVSVEKNEIETLQPFIDQLINTMRDESGVGIAAPQVDVLKRIFIMESKENIRYPNRNSFDLLIVINPELEYIGNEMIDSWEGCLSIPNIRGKLKRYKKVRLSGLNRLGEAFKVELDGFAAIVAQHEYDHLNGILFLDQMSNLKTLTFQKEYETYWVG